jgi:hypothetical protein
MFYILNGAATVFEHNKQNEAYEKCTRYGNNGRTNHELAVDAIARGRFKIR